VIIQHEASLLTNNVHMCLFNSQECKRWRCIVCKGKHHWWLWGFHQIL